MTTLTSLPAVETPQLVVREMELRDGKAFAAYMTQEAYQRHITVRFADENEVRAFVTRTAARQGDERRHIFHLAAEEKLSGEAVGDGFIIMQRPGIAEIGWGVHPAMWAIGLGSEIGRALAGLAFERLKAERAWCKVMKDNPASARIARRIGMRHIQSEDSYNAGGGRVASVDVFSLTAAQYFDLAY